MEEHCYHCGDEVGRKPIEFNGKSFCCLGCKGVYQLLTDNQLADFYSYEQTPGIKPSGSSSDKYAFLDLAEIRARFVKYEDEKLVKVVIHLPNIHCSSCIYLLENAHRANPSIIQSQVHFSRKEATISFLKDRLTLGELALFLDRIGYPPNFQKQTEKHGIQRGFLLKIGLAGFAFGSIMLWSFPEYTGIAKDDQAFRNFTTWLTFLVSIPVLLFSAQEYYLSAFKAIRAKHLNLDIPITLGIIALYVQSLMAIFQHQGPGYMDSFAGFIFFLLIGKWFQNRTYQSLSFDRDYTSYFPLAVRKIRGNAEEILPIEQIVEGDLIKIRHQEIIPCDSILTEEEASIDYSFVTGESEGITIKQGDLIYAGGKVLSASITLRVQHKSDRSHLTQLWNERLESKNTSRVQRYQDKVAAYFLWAVLLISLISAIVYLIIAPQMVFKVVVSVLIVACPCALALSTPFAFGNAMRKMGQLGAYLKNADVVEQMADIDVIVLDKTGTLTDTRTATIEQHKPIPNSEDYAILYAMVESSTHPMAAAIFNFLQDNTSPTSVKLDKFEEVSGKGIKAKTGDIHYILGSANFTEQTTQPGTIFFTKNGEYITSFSAHNVFRQGLNNLINTLQSQHEVFVLSGDNDKDMDSLLGFGIKKENIHFNQTPSSKFTFNEQVQQQGKKVMMIGDGLNDTAAIAQANVGVAISEDMFKFTPSSDMILDATQLRRLPDFIRIATYARFVLKICLGFSITYNLTGIFFAVTAQLTPLVAAILMPMSSITIVGLSTLMIYFKFLSLKN